MTEEKVEYALEKQDVDGNIVKTGTWTPEEYNTIPEEERLMFPRVGLAQPLSQCVTDQLASPGDLYNSLTQDNYGKHLVFIPFRIWYGRILFGASLMEGVKCRSDDCKMPWPTIANTSEALEDGRIECPCHLFGVEWRTPKQVQDDAALFNIYSTYKCWNESAAGLKSPCQKVANFLSLVVDAEKDNVIISPSPIIVNFRATSFGVARRIVSRLRYVNQPPWVFIWRLSTEERTNEKGTFYTFKASSVGRPSEKLQELAVEAYEAFKGQSISAHEEAESSFAANAGDSATTSPDVNDNDVPY